MVRARARDLERFQSMLPVGGATSLSSWLHLRLTNFNSRSPRGERQESTQIRYFHPYFNPRSPRGERLGARSSVSAPSLFQSTLSVGRATRTSGRLCNSNRFQSTLSEGRATLCSLILVSKLSYFNPRSPRGERPPQSAFPGACPLISIHALRGESDKRRTESRHPQDDFNPRSPRGERLE